MPTREQLYRLVWEQPIQQLARSFDISDVGLAKICHKAGIPIPARGYWAKVQAGKPVNAPPPLAPRAFGASNDIEIRTRPAHQTQQQSPYHGSWDAPPFQSPEERRRLRLLNALFLALGRCGALPLVRGREARELSALVGSVQVPMSLEFKHNKTSQTMSQGNRPTDAVLRFELDAWATGKPPLVWEDTELRSLEDQMSELVTQVLVSAEVMLRAWLQQRYVDEIDRRATLVNQAQLKREAQGREERERRNQEAQQRMDRLLGEVSAWRLAEDIRAFVRARLNALTELHPSAQADVHAWANWALQIATDMDPLHTLDDCAQKQ